MPPLWFCRSNNISCLIKLIKGADVIDVKFFAAREGNDSQTVDVYNSVKSKTTFVGGHTTYLTLNEWVRCDFVEWKVKLNSPPAWSIYCCGCHFQVLCQIFFSAVNSEDRPTVDRKNSAKCRANLLAEHWIQWTPTSNVSVFAVSFADLQREGYKFHSPLI